ncbi:MAG: D-beta-D-heptose 7-phosphate kinase / D-beta-D-heptose 1-phosphate adenosyltransferase [Thermoleophilaceae bacterium]|nr:D-beta-D-heptose 7-phosphate kinase / D-beta-D-heptose 1-phosphate adenosyltransferase [Thermoleophilaceae bacterium]
MKRPLVVIGDSLLDRDIDGSVDRLSPDAPVPVLDEAGVVARPGGAALAAALAASDGGPVTLITALARDDAAGELRFLLEAAGVDVLDLGLDGHTPEKVRFRTGQRPLLRLDRGGDGGAIGSLPAAGRAAVDWAAAVLVSDYGRGVAGAGDVRDAVAAVVGRVPTVWDPHPRGPAPPPGVSVTTPNDAEVTRLEPEPRGADTAAASGRATALRERWNAGALCMTRGRGGALLVRSGRPALAVAAPPVGGGDPCGAGDRFSTRLALQLARGAEAEDAVVDAVACASYFVGAGGAGALRAGVDGAAPLTAEDGVAVAERIRGAGGTLVATGGCFDLLHAGHVRTLEAARRLGDALVVCLNSDESVRRLKGPDRPLVPECDRAAVLGALSCVDAVLVFGEDTPERALEQLRPQIWVKGGDYEGADLPEEHVLRRWGGRALLVPYVEGRSTTRLIEEAACRA